MASSEKVEADVPDEPISERHWIRGNKAAWRAMILHAARELGYDDPLAQAAALVAERHDAIVALREVCEEFGANEWMDSLHLADIISKNLHRQLSRRQ